MDGPEHLAETKYAAPSGSPPATPGPTPPGSATPAGSPNRPPSHTPSGSARSLGSRTAVKARFIAGEMFGDRFRIVELLGRGGMGEVYRADDLQLTETIALKFLALEASGDQEWLDRFRQEVRLSRQIAHPNICRVYDILEQDRQWCLSMEYIAGESLAQNLRRMGRPSPEKALEIARQICGGLAAIHDVGLVHRDLKPSNIMIDDRGRVRITDFGLAGVVQEIQGLEVKAGTPAYMSPEQISGREVTLRSDIYALGLVLYELFTGKRTFDADSFVQWQKAHQETNPQTPTSVVADIDPRVERVILRCLEKDPANRPASVLAVLAALPGGDPLAAALAAGETPSAELIAASGESGALSPARAALCAAIFVLGVVTVGLLNERSSLFRLVDLPKSREVLLDRARDVVTRFAPELKIADDAGAFAVNDEKLERIAATDPSPQRWQRLRSDGDAVDFWYRAGSALLVPNNVSMGRVSPTDPPMRPGMVNVRLDPFGRLLVFERYLQQTSVSETAQASTQPHISEWVSLFDAAGLNMSDFDSAGSSAVPPVGCDQRHSWTQRDVPDSAAPLAVDAGTLGPKITYFEVHPLGEVAAPAAASATPAYENTVWVVLNIVSLAAALLLARHNMSKHRCYECGARRVALAALIMGFVWWLLHAQHVLNIVAEFELFRSGMGRVLFIAAWVWLLYLGLEPFVRRIWPATLISWTRLLEGRLRDPAIGRDILIGAAAGAGAVVVTQLQVILPGLFGAPTPKPLWPLLVTGLGDSNYVAAWLIDPMLLLMPMFCLFLLVLARLLIRHPLACRITVAVLLVLMLGMNDLLTGPMNVRWLVAALWALNVWVGLWICTRFGLLALMVMFFVHQCVRSSPLTFDLTAWYAPVGIACVAVVAILVAAAFHVSLGGRKLFRTNLLGA